MLTLEQFDAKQAEERANFIENLAILNSHKSTLPDFCTITSVYNRLYGKTYLRVEVPCVDDIFNIPRLPVFFWKGVFSIFWPEKPNHPSYSKATQQLFNAHLAQGDVIYLTSPNSSDHIALFTETARLYIPSPKQLYKFHAFRNSNRLLTQPQIPYPTLLRSDGTLETLLPAQALQAHLKTA